MVATIFFNLLRNCWSIFVICSSIQNIDCFISNLFVNVNKMVKINQKYWFFYLQPESRCIQRIPCITKLFIQYIKVTLQGNPITINYWYLILFNFKMNYPGAPRNSLDYSPGYTSNNFRYLKLSILHFPLQDIKFTFLYLKPEISPNFESKSRRKIPFKTFDWTISQN